MNVYTCIMMMFVCVYVQSTTIAELIARGVKEFYPEKFSLSPPE